MRHNWCRQYPSGEKRRKQCFDHPLSCGKRRKPAPSTWRARGVSRRQFLSLCGRVAVVLGCGGLVAGGETKALAREVAERLTNARRPLVVWLQLRECTGYLENALPLQR